MMLSDTSPPRISFSRDLGQADALPRRDVSLLDVNCDFEFSINRSFRPNEPSSADELFSHGIIKAMRPKYRSSLEDAAPKAGDIHHLYSLPPLPSPQNNTKKESTTQFNKDVNASEDMDQQNSNNNNTKPQSTSFWGFKRSSSLNQDSKKSLLCSLPEFLRRSNSTGSAPNPKKLTTIYKDGHDPQKRQSSSSISMSKSSSASSSSSSNQHRMLPRRPSRKGQGNGVRISPVLNIPSPYISRGTAKLFCLSSFLYPTGKEKKQKN